MSHGAYLVDPGLQQVDLRKVLLKLGVCIIVRTTFKAGGGPTRACIKVTKVHQGPSRSMTPPGITTGPPA